MYQYWEDREEPLDRDEDEEDETQEKDKFGEPAVKKVKWEDKIVPEMDHLDCADSETVIIHRSDSFPDQLQIDLPKLTMKTQIFCNADHNELLRIRIMKEDEDHGTHRLYGFHTTTLNILQEI